MPPLPVNRTASGFSITATQRVGFGMLDPRETVELRVGESATSGQIEQVMRAALEELERRSM